MADHEFQMLMKEKLKYHGYSYKEFVEEVSKVDGLIPHTNLTLPPLRLYIAMPTVLFKTR